MVERGPCALCGKRSSDDSDWVQSSRRGYWARSCRDCINEGERAKRGFKRKVISRIKAGPCADCGNTFPSAAMDFDHRDPATKEFEIGDMAACTSSWERLMAEIDKCDLVCSNCHRIRTYGKGSRSG